MICRMQKKFISCINFHCCKSGSRSIALISQLPYSHCLFSKSFSQDWRPVKRSIFLLKKILNSDQSLRTLATNARSHFQAVHLVSINSTGCICNSKRDSVKIEMKRSSTLSSGGVKMSEEPPEHHKKNGTVQVEQQDGEEGAYYQRGEHTLKVPMSLFEENRRRLCDRLRHLDGSSSTTMYNSKEFQSSAWVVLMGGCEVPFNDTDVSYQFRQESFFQWAFGVEEPDCFGAINVESNRSILFFPRFSEESALWAGQPVSLQEFRDRYQVDETYYVDQMADVFQDKEARVLLTLKGKNTDSGLETIEAKFPGIERFTVDNSPLYHSICECRVIKTAKELEVLRYVAYVSCLAHKTVMRKVRPGFAEFQAEAAFLHHCYTVGGCRHASYTCICGSGKNGSILHYGHAGAPNNKVLRDGEMCLFDMGGNYCGYAADITCSYPVNGKFTEDQKLIYNAVLRARDAVMMNAKPGVLWSDMHLLANSVMLESLKIGGLLRGEVSDMIEVGLHAIFQPHGLGHFLGLDVHDVGGYLSGSPPRPDKPGLNKLRTARILKAGMVLTIEPGCYFIDWLLNKAQQNQEMSKFIVWENVARFKDFGGVRIEDDVLITETGTENLSKYVPRTVEEIEEFMADDKERKRLPHDCLKDVDSKVSW